MTNHTLAALALLCFTACAGGEAKFPPSSAGLGLPAFSDPVPAAIINARAALADPARRIGDNPAFAARIVGQVEFAAAMMTEPRFHPIAPLVEGQLLRARSELRAAIGLVPGASPQAVITALAGAAAALDRGDEAGADRALAPVSAAPRQTRQALRGLPFMRDTSDALALAEWSLDRLAPTDE
jgi:hypothetical protein